MGELSAGFRALEEARRRVDVQVEQLRDYATRSITVLSVVFGISTFAADAALTSSAEANSTLVVIAALLSGFAFVGLGAAAYAALFQPAISAHLDVEEVLSHYSLEGDLLAAHVARSIADLSEKVGARANRVSNVVFAAYLLGLASSGAWLLTLVVMEVA